MTYLLMTDSDLIKQDPAVYLHKTKAKNDFVKSGQKLTFILFPLFSKPLQGYNITVF